MLSKRREVRPAVRVTPSAMAYGGKIKDPVNYQGSKRPWACRTIPDDFRETFLELGWEAEYHYGCSSRVMYRWVGEAGGQELCDARRAYLKERGRRQPCDTRHVKGWSAEKLEALRR